MEATACSPPPSPPSPTLSLRIRHWHIHAGGPGRSVEITVQNKNKIHSPLCQVKPLQPFAEADRERNEKLQQREKLSFVFFFLVLGLPSFPENITVREQLDFIIRKQRPTYILTAKEDTMLTWENIHMASYNSHYIIKYNWTKYAFYTQIKNTANCYTAPERLHNISSHMQTNRDSFYCNHQSSMSRKQTIRVLCKHFII